MTRSHRVVFSLMITEDSNRLPYENQALFHLPVIPSKEGIFDDMLTEIPAFARMTNKDRKTTS